jgi:hypothetical protein
MRSSSLQREPGITSGLCSSLNQHEQPQTIRTISGFRRARLTESPSCGPALPPAQRDLDRSPDRPVQGDDGVLFERIKYPVDPL